MKALDLLRSRLAANPEETSVSSVSSPDQESRVCEAIPRARARGQVQDQEEATNLLKNNETTPDTGSSKNFATPKGGTDKTDKSPDVAALADIVAYFDNASRGPCIRCRQPVTRLGETQGFRSAFGDLVHLRCPGK